MKRFRVGEFVVSKECVDVFQVSKILKDGNVKVVHKETIIDWDGRTDVVRERIVKLYTLYKLNRKNLVKYLGFDDFDCGIWGC